MDHLQWVSNNMRVEVIYHTEHHIDLNMIRYETLGYVVTLLKSTNMVQVLRVLFQSHIEILCEQNILLVVGLLQYVPLLASYKFFPANKISKLPGSLFQFIHDGFDYRYRFFMVYFLLKQFD